MDTDPSGLGDCAFGHRWVGFALMNIHERLYEIQLILGSIFFYGQELIENWWQVLFVLPYSLP